MFASFKATKAERALVKKIADRARDEGFIKSKKQPQHWYTRQCLIMDLLATNANGCKMDFDRLLKADGISFIHDIGGIARHMDRDTGQLRNHFLPRTHSRTPKAA